MLLFFRIITLVLLLFCIMFIAIVEYCNIEYCGTIVYCGTLCELYYNLCERH